MEMTFAAIGMLMFLSFVVGLGVGLALGVFTHNGPVERAFGENDEITLHIVSTKNLEALKRVLLDTGVYFDAVYENLLKKIHYSSTGTVNLVIKTPNSLGFNTPANYFEVIAKAEQQGLKPCPQDTAVHFAIQNPTLRIVSWRLIFATKPIDNFGQAVLTIATRFGRADIGTIRVGDSDVIGQDTLLVFSKETPTKDEIKK